MTDTIYPTHPNVPPNAPPQPAANPYLVQQIGTPVPTAYPMPQIPQNNQPAPQIQPQPAPQQAAPEQPAYSPTQIAATQAPATQAPATQAPAPQTSAPQIAEAPDRYLEDVSWSNFSGEVGQTGQVTQGQYQAQPAQFEPQAYNPVQPQALDSHQAQMMPNTAFPPMPPLMAPNGVQNFLTPDMPAAEPQNLDGQTEKTSAAKGLLSRFKRTPKLKPVKAKLPKAGLPNVAMPNVAMPNVAPSAQLQSVPSLDMGTPSHEAIAKSAGGARKSFIVPFIAGLLTGVVLTCVALTLMGGAADKKEYGVVAKSGAVLTSETPAVETPVNDAADVTAENGLELEIKENSSFLDAQLSSN